MPEKKEPNIFYRENRIRSILKSLSYRVTSMCLTMIISFFVTRNVKMALGIGGIDFVVKIIYYYFHERIWHYSSIGRR